MSRSTRPWLSGSVVPVQPATVDLLTAYAPVAARWGRGYVFGALDDRHVRTADVPRHGAFEKRVLEPRSGQDDIERHPCRFMDEWHDPGAPHELRVLHAEREAAYADRHPDPPTCA